MRLRKRQRVILVITSLALAGTAVALVATALQDEIAFFVTPTNITQDEIQEGRRFRLGGLVVDGSVVRDSEGLVTFELTDTVSTVKVRYAGILPDLFREGQGIVAQGELGDDRLFLASEVLAKHDENYMPRELADELRKVGYLQHDGEPMQ